MNFDQASAVSQICFDMRLADFPRARNRARIANLFNGVPPFSEEDADANGVKINVNPLGGTTLAHDARAQFYGAMLRPGRFFDAKVDTGPKFKRSNISNIVTQAMNKKMKRSMGYFETFRSKFAMNVLHGIGPTVWQDDNSWAPKAAAVEDIGIPANTLLTMDNLPFFYVYRTFTVPELIRLTNRKNVDKSWNMPLVRKIIKWVDKETQALMGTNWPEVWSPEKTAERIKGDGGFYASDQVPTVNCFDFYFWNDEDGVEGWNRRMIMDAWSEPQGVGSALSMSVDKDKAFAKDDFLFNSGKRKYASRISELMSFQFADLSAVAPFRYHSVRSLGYLVYGVCNLQNRMYCRFNEAAFEASMNYLRVNSQDDAERALKIDLINRGVIDKSVEFVKAADRWQVNAALIEMAMNENRRIIDSNTSSYTQQPATADTSTRKTKFQVMAEVQQTTALVQAAFNQAYRYQEGEYREIFRRFMIPNSRDIDVREFQAECLRQKVPMECMCPDAWEIEPTQVMGAGNSTMQMAISEQLMNMRNLYDPEPQREILRDVTFNLTGDAAQAERWVPDKPTAVTDAVHDAQLATGTLMLGLPVSLKTGMNHKEYVVTLVGNLQMMIEQNLKTPQNPTATGMATQEEINGYQNVAQAAEQHLQILAEDPEEKQFVAMAQKQIAKLMNEVKGFAQRLQQQQQSQSTNPIKMIESINYKDAPDDIKRQLEMKAGLQPSSQKVTDPKIIKAVTSDQLKKESHANKLAQQQVAFEQKQAQEREAFEAEQVRQNAETVHNMKRKEVEEIE